MQNKKSRSLGVMLLSLGLSMTADAGILASQTRVLFVEGQREKSLMLVNINDYPVVLQTWVDQGEANPDRTDLPFIVLPPISRMAPHALQSIRIIYNDQAIAQDRESVFWLNLYEIPAVKSEKIATTHYLSMAMNTQLKIFYRPKNLKNYDVLALAKQLHFSLQIEGDTWRLICNNPTAYYASLVNISLQHQQQHLAVHAEMDMMSAAKSIRQYHFDGVLPRERQYQLRFDLIDDHGQQHHFEQVIRAGD